MKSNIIVAPTIHIAELYRDAFKCDPNDWSVGNYWKKLDGWLFDRIVFVRPQFVMSSGDIVQLEQAIADAHKRTTIEGSVKVI